MSHAARRFEWIAGTVLALLLLIGFGVLKRCEAHYNVYGRSNDGATEGLQSNVAAALSCLEAQAPGLRPGQDTAAVAEQLTDCAGTDILNQDDDAIRPIDWLHSENGTIAVTSTATADRLNLTLLTESSAVATAGVSQDRTTLGTCWQVASVVRSGTLSSPSGTPCKESVATRANIQEQVAFDGLELAGAAGGGAGV
ncbi:hypothetical protein [Puerhibacterium sp. TATVAM-FAB25]|uniref:hypothetical protein n=1 Tax=Puerhibacterium sp. TATVAM-FAB25 TaxID=3093699 RepID=UPI0039788E0D